MNKRFVKFLEELAEENERLEKHLESRGSILETLDKENLRLQFEVKRLKRLLRERKAK